MADYLTDIQEGQPLDSIQDVYQTHATIIKHLIDSDTYDKMMVKVIKDIVENDDIFNNIKGLKRKQRIFLGEIIYMWAIMEWSNYFQNAQRGTVLGRGRSGNLVTRFVPVPTYWERFIERFEDSFGNDVYWECRYKSKAKWYEIKVTIAHNNHFNVIMRECNRWSIEVPARLVAKYNEKNHTLKISYIEFIDATWRIDFTPKVFRPELFKGVKKIIDQIKEAKGSKPEIICSKKYLDVYEDALKRKYLEDPKQSDEFMI